MTSNNGLLTPACDSLLATSCAANWAAAADAASLSAALLAERKARKRKSLQPRAESERIYSFFGWEKTKDLIREGIRQCTMCIQVDNLPSLKIKPSEPWCPSPDTFSEGFPASVVCIPALALSWAALLVASSAALLAAASRLDVKVCNAERLIGLKNAWAREQGCLPFQLGKVCNTRRLVLFPCPCPIALVCHGCHVCHVCPYVPCPHPVVLSPCVNLMSSYVFVLMSCLCSYAKVCVPITPNSCLRNV